jgi:hypothetical protein
MEIDRNRSMYLMMLYVYLKSYQEAIDDFEVAIKNIGYPDEALMAIKQKFGERVDRVSKELVVKDK